MAASTIILPLTLTSTGIAQAADANGWLSIAFITGKDPREIAYNGQLSKEGALYQERKMEHDQAASDDGSGTYLR